MRAADGPQITMEDLQIVEHVVREDPKVIEQCQISGIPKEDMYKVYCDRKSPKTFLSPFADNSKHGQSDSMKDSATRFGYSRH